MKAGETLTDIAIRFRSSIHEILNANIICDPNIIVTGLPLIIPEQGMQLPRAGAGPYYVVQPSDTLECLAYLFGIAVKDLVEVNHLHYTGELRVGTELLLLDHKEKPQEIYESWNHRGDTECISLSLHEFFYRGTYEWEGVGDTAIPYLSKLINHRCDGARFGALESLGRIASFHAKNALELAIRQSSDSLFLQYARLALKRIHVVQQTKSKRFHLITSDTYILQEPNFETSFKTRVPISKGTIVVGVRWRIPSPTQEEGPRGGLQIYDYIQVVQTGQKGFLPRSGYDGINLI